MTGTGPGGEPPAPANSQAGSPDRPKPYGTVEGQPPPAAYPYGTDRGGAGSPDAGRAAVGRTTRPPTTAPPSGLGSTGLPASPEDVARARRLGRLAVYNAVVGVIFSLLFFPVGLVFDVIAIVLGIRARRAAVVAGRSEASGVLAVVLGGVGLSMALVLGALLAAFWTEIGDYRSCARGANTHAASADCQAALQDDLLRRLGLNR